MAVRRGQWPGAGGGTRVWWYDGGSVRCTTPAGTGAPTPRSPCCGSTSRTSAGRRPPPPAMTSPAGHVTRPLHPGTRGGAPERAGRTPTPERAAVSVARRSPLTSRGHTSRFFTEPTDRLGGMSAGPRFTKYLTIWLNIQYTWWHGCRVVSVLEHTPGFYPRSNEQHRLF